MSGRWRVLVRAATLGAAILMGTAVSAQTPVVEYYHLDALGSVRAVTNAAGAVVSRHEYEPFGEEWQPVVPPTTARQFTGKERDPETGLDYFGARYYRADLGQFTTVDPFLDPSTATADPQRWNRFAYARGNPLRFVDPDGRDLLPVGAQALERVRSTVPAALRAEIVLGAGGMVDRSRMNAVQTDDQNFIDLRRIVNHAAVMEVSTSGGAVLEGQFREFYYTSALEARRDARRLGVAAADLSAIGDQLFLGNTGDLVQGRLPVTLSDGKGRAGGATQTELAVTAAHEMLGHGLPRMNGERAVHDNGGPTDKRIRAIDERTRRVYEPPH